MSWGEIYNTSWWGVALDTARTVKARPDFFGSQLNLLTSEQPNLVVNGTFDNDSDWTKTGSWQISNGVAYITSPYAPSYLYQALGLIVGRIYKIEIDIVSLSSGNIRFRCGNSAPSQSISDWIGTLGKHTIHLICGGLGDIFWVESDNSFIGSIDNISVQVVRAELDQIEAKKCLADWIHTTALKDLNN